jgi:hypothetical protein
MTLSSTLLVCTDEGTGTFEFGAVHMSANGTSRHFAATQQFSRFRSEADIGSAALAEPDL